jgi:hypothetical protein
MSEHLKFTEADIEEYIVDMYGAPLGYEPALIARQVMLGDWGVADVIIGERHIVSGGIKITVIEIKARPPRIEDFGQLCRYVRAIESHSPKEFQVCGILYACEYITGKNDFPFLTCKLHESIEYIPYTVSLLAGIEDLPKFNGKTWHKGKNYIGRKWAPIVRQLKAHTTAHADME